MAYIIDTQHTHTMSSPQLQPYISAPHMMHFCHTFSAQAYLRSLPSARQLAADVNSLGTWLAQLSASSHHISVLARGDSQGHDGGVKASPRAVNSCSIIHSSSSCGGNITHTRTSARGLLDIDVSTVRPVLLQTAKTTLGWVPPDCPVLQRRHCSAEWCCACCALPTRGVFYPPRAGTARENTVTCDRNGYL